MPSATTFAYRAPVAPRRRDGRAWLVRRASVPLVAMLLTVPIVPLQPGDPARVAAGAPFIAARSGQSSELVPASLTEALDPATGQAFGAAQPFMARYSDAASALRAETCLTEAIYYEGALEPEAGQRAIAQVVLNRVRHPAYPDTVCGVVFQGQERSTGCQFTFTCDGARARAPVPNLWRRANLIARAALGGAVVPEVGLSTHYHADYVNPYWSASLEPEGQIGRHLFYRWRGGAGQAPAFSMRYSGREPLIAAWSARPAGPSPAQIQTTGVFAVVAPAIDAAPTVTRVGARGLLLQSRTDAASGGASATEGATQPTAAPAPFRARPLPLAEKAEGPA